MTVAFESGYVLPGGDFPLSHARILHARNRFQSRSIVASSTAAGYFADAPDNGLTFEKWAPFDNLLTAPDDFTNAAWTKGGVTIGANTERVTSDTSTGNHRVYQSINFSSIEYVVSVVVCLESASRFRLQMGSPSVDFNLLDMTLVNNGGAVGAIKKIAQNKYLCRVYATPGSGVDDVQVRLQNDAGALSYMGDGSSFLTVDQLSVHPSIATWDFETFGSQEGDVFCVAGHNIGSGLGRLQFSYGSSPVIIGEVEPEDDSPVMFVHEGQTDADWRLTVDRCANPKISVIRVGKLLQMPRPFYGGHAPIDFNRVTTLRGNDSEKGEFLGLSKVRTMLRSQFAWRNTEYDWVEDNWPDVQKALETEPAFVAWRPNAYPQVGYVQMSGKSTPETQGQRDLMRVQLDVKGLGYD